MTGLARVNRQNDIFGVRKFWNIFDDFQDSLDDVFKNFGLSRIVDTDISFFPAIDSYNKDGKLNIDIEGSRMVKDDIKICIEETNRLIITGEKKIERDESPDGLYISERTYGSFRREFTIPKNCDIAQIAATFDNGVLKITIPKKDEEKPQVKEIEIK